MARNMSNPIFDEDNWEPMFKISKDMVIDAKGRYFTRMNENMVMELDTGKVRYTTPWSDGENNES